MKEIYLPGAVDLYKLVARHGKNDQLDRGIFILDDKLWEKHN